MNFARRASAPLRALLPQGIRHSLSLTLPRASALRTGAVSAGVAAVLAFAAPSLSLAAGSSAQAGAGVPAATTAPQAKKADEPKPAAESKTGAKAGANPTKGAAVPAAAAAAATKQVLPEPKALPPDVSGECEWTGKRIVSLLARDDVDQAKRFLEFFRLFSCKEAHLAPTFRCVIAGEQDGATSEEFAERVDRCWTTVE